MKILKRFTATILALAILVLMLPTVSVFATDTITRYGRTKLDTNLQKLYDRLVLCYKNDSPTQIEINPGWNITSDQLHKTFEMFYSDYPEYFWVKKGGYNWSTSNNVVVSFTPKEYFFDNVATAKSKYNEKVKELTSGLSEKSDYEKAKILHDRLCKTATYTSDCNNHQNSYGALVEGKAVCNGYARAYQHLLNEVGITAWYVSGTSVSPSSGSVLEHAWNMVKLDGKWYYTDVTWDDQGSNIFYAYFNITTKQLLKDHTIDAVYKALVPTATATTANYYKKENRIFTSYDEERFVKLLKKGNNKTQIYIDGDANDVNAFIASIDSKDIAKQLSGLCSFSVARKITILGNSFILKFDITEKAKHTYSNACDKTCNACQDTRTVAHKYTTTTTKATLSKNGSIVKKCTVCGKTSKSTIKYAKSFKLTTTNYTYNGKVKTPGVIVKDSAGKTLKKNTDYTVTYASGRKNVGTYKVTIKMKGKYLGTKTLTFKINPVKTSVSKLTAGKKSITVNISKKSTQVSGYQIQYSTSKKFTNAKTKTISSYKTTKYTLKSLSAKKTYYVRVRTYKTVSGKKYYSGWSSYKYVKTK
ncbi:MAG: fibronectin type III domain-containing protein [Clostridia bacterium]|nr:fibronectin type III domain-containing protein [Clostridia bacterium]